MRRLIVFVLVLAAALTPIAGGKAPPPPDPGVVVSTGTAPCGIAGRGATIWVAVYASGRLLGIDADTGRVTRRIHVGPWSCRVALGANTAWVTRDRPPQRLGQIVRVNLTTGRLKRVTLGAGAFDVLLAAGSVWATSFETGTVARIDPATATLARVFEVGGHPAGLAFCGGRIWVGHGRTATWVTSIDPATREMRRIDVFNAAPGWPTCIREALWVVTPDTVVRIDARSGRLRTVLRVGETLADAAAGPDGLVWVTDKQHSLVHRITPDGRHALGTFPAGPGAFALARMGDTMWVTSFAGSDVRSFSP